MFWLPKFFFCDLRTDSILYSTCVVSLFPQRWKCLDTPTFIFHQNNSGWDLYLGRFSSWKGIEGAMDVTSWHHLKSESLAVSFMAGKFVSQLPGCCHPDKCILRIFPLCPHDKFDNCSALGYSVKSRKTKLMYAQSALFSCLGGMAACGRAMELRNQNCDSSSCPHSLWVLEMPPQDLCSFSVATDQACSQCTFV